MSNENVNAESSIAVENQRTIKIGSLKNSNSKTIIIDKTAMYTIAQVIEKAGFAVPETVRTESGIIEASALLPDNCKMIALGLTNVKNGMQIGYEEEDCGCYDDDDNNEEDDMDYEDEYRDPVVESNPVNEDIPCEFKRCIKIGSLKSSNSRIITIDKRSMYTIAQVIEQAGFAVPDVVRTENGVIESTALLPDTCKQIALGLTNVKNGL